jgi:hypothetical protein
MSKDQFVKKWKETKWKKHQIKKCKKYKDHFKKPKNIYKEKHNFLV